MYATVDQPYIVTVPPATKPITVAEVKAWLKIPSIVVDQDAIIQMIINSVTTSVEAWTKRTLINTTFLTYRDVFGDINETPVSCVPSNFNAYSFNAQNSVPVTIRRSLLQSIVSIQYTLNGVLQTMPSTDYKIIKKDSFSKIIPVTQTPTPDFPSVWAIADNVPQGIQISFVAGFGANATFVPDELKTAMLMHCASIYTNRGDCSPSDTSCSCATAPAMALAVYNQYRILDFVL